MRQLFYFGWEQAKSCVFPLVIFLSLGLTQVVSVPGLARYDLIFLICTAAQALMLVSRMETMDELKVIGVFHLIGLALELYKVHMGSWSYPEEAVTKVYGVPLYSGFMYASVASYMCQAWRRLDLRLTHWPPTWMVVLLSAVIYFNFYTHHFVYDIRWILKILTLFVFLRTMVFFTVRSSTYKMPLSLAFVLIGFFIWVAENIVTLLGGWSYPHQQSGWDVVHVGKISSWLLLVIVSFLIVAFLKHFKQNRNP
ncbi:DUF817 domain-containing protein [Salibacterium halotolerans]|uniref:Uncharacterized membrane protein YoaT, DUF817 family n=1 Tax=Salibacterium halotolerans TaxID=1884432 RepID=A0A1I5U657_9BACI|nr:DUF817 domain-containing protein [Salibacterium halotolerans]SFP90734.1 Uncharacterized membrane protein YoaT, DUF817 family [Salibacterium halotolerans]